MTPLNLVAGFEFAPDQPASLNVGGKSFDLFTQKDAAWLLDTTQNGTLAGALRSGNSVVIQGLPRNGGRGRWSDKMLAEIIAPSGNAMPSLRVSPSGGSAKM